MNHLQNNNNNQDCNLHPRRITVKCILKEDLDLQNNLYAASQAFIYHILTQANPTLGAEIHDRDSKKGFTFRPFRFEPAGTKKTTNKRNLYQAGTVATLEVLTHTDEIFQFFMQGVVESKSTGHYAAFLNHNIEIAEISVEQDIQMVLNSKDHGSIESFLITIITPMYFRLPHSQQALDLKAKGYKLRDKRVRFPDPVLLYRSIREQILNYSGYEQWIPTYEEFTSSVFCDKIINFSNITVKSKRDQNKFEEHEGFVGKVLYFLDGTPELRNKNYKFLLLGTYFGAGSRTSMGFGQFELEPQPFQSIQDPQPRTHQTQQDEDYPTKKIVKIP